MELKDCTKGRKVRVDLGKWGAQERVWARNSGGPATTECNRLRSATPIFSLNSSLMSTIQYIDKERRELLEDLREIARNYQPLRETDPQKYRRTVLREMNDYLHRIKQHPVFSEFCELTHINQDEFMNDILQQIKNELF